MNKRDVRQHRHILRRATRSTFACIDDCSYREVKSFLFGRIVRCPFCKEEFQLTLEDLKRALPRCPNCSNTKTKRITNELETLFAEEPPSETPSKQETLFEAASQKDDEEIKHKVGF